MASLHARALAHLPIALLLALALDASAAAAGDPRAAVRQFLQAQAEGLPGRVEITLAPGALPACAQPQPFLPTGVRAWGRITVGVRCVEGTPWTRYLSARVAVIASYQVAARAIAVGEALRPEDALAEEGDLASLPAGVLVDAEELAGKVASHAIAAGAPLRRGLMRGMIVVQRGQEVRVRVRGAGFHATMEGRAMTDAAVGATVQVKARNGRLLTGVVQPDGSVERAS